MPVPPQTPAAAPAAVPTCFALLGNPNTGKTTLFNRMCGIRSKTANFPGSTVEARLGTCARDGDTCRLVDLPGIYSLNLDRPESRICRDYLKGEVRLGDLPGAVLIVADATNLVRNLVFVSQALQQGLPAVVALTMIDVAQRRGLSIDIERLAARLGCPVVPVNARTGKGVEALVRAMVAPRMSDADLADPIDVRAATTWAGHTLEGILGGAGAVGHRQDTLTDRLDTAFTHPVLGLGVFAAVMVGLFYTIFSLATVPMDGLNWIFSRLGAAAGSVIPPGAIHDLIVDGVVSGIAGTAVFLPQICLLFFLIALLEDTGYLARAAFVMDRLLRWFGLPGQAFVPLLSAHACAIPAIMSTRLIPDRRDRIATVLVAPFLSCSARLPVYVLLIGILFAGRPFQAGLAFTACYLLGAVAALLTALLARRTLLRGPSMPMVLELPAYRMPSVRTALLLTWDRATTFIRKAGTVILAICIVLWWLSAYPQYEPPAAGPVTTARVAGPSEALEHSWAGRLGHAVEPVFSPLGYDWQLSVGVMTSFAAREVFVSTMAVLLADSDEIDEGSVLDRITTARRDDGTPIFTTATAASLLVFYVLAMQCLPTLPVTRRETGSWWWAALQWGWMTGLAWGMAFVTYRLVLAAGGT